MVPCSPRSRTNTAAAPIVATAIGPRVGTGSLVNDRRSANGERSAWECAPSSCRVSHHARDKTPPATIASAGPASNTRGSPRPGARLRRQHRSGRRYQCDRGSAAQQHRVGGRHDTVADTHRLDQSDHHRHGRHLGAHEKAIAHGTAAWAVASAEWINTSVDPATEATPTAASQAAEHNDLWRLRRRTTPQLCPELRTRPQHRRGRRRSQGRSDGRGTRRGSVCVCAPARKAPLRDLPCTARSRGQPQQRSTATTKVCLSCCHEARCRRPAAVR